MKKLFTLSLSLSLSLCALAQTGDPRKDYPLSDPRNPDCPCHELQKIADKEYERLQKKEKKEKQNDAVVQRDTNEPEVQTLAKLEVKEITGPTKAKDPDSVKAIRDHQVLGTGSGSYDGKAKKKKRFGQKLSAKWQKKSEKLFKRSDKYKIKRWTCFDW